MLQNFLGEGQTQVGLFVFWVVGDTGLCIWNGQSVIFQLDMSEGPVGIVHS